MSQRYEWEDEIAVDELDLIDLGITLDLPEGVEVAGIAFVHTDDMEGAYHHYFKGDYEMADFDVIDDIRGDINRVHEKHQTRAETFYGKASFDAVTKGTKPNEQ